MSVVRNHIYSVDPADLDELLNRRSSLIATVRASHPGLSATRLVRLDDGTYCDTWHWETAEQLGAALAAIPTFAEAPATMSLTRDGTAQNGEVLDER
jgi:hypothetical protein